MAFVHLHVHTEFSLLDGYAPIEQVVQAAVDFKMPAIAITDHGTMSGVVKFYKTCKKKGIKPIIGCEVYVAEDRRRKDAGGRKAHHLVLLAKNQEGYKNLLHIVSDAYTQGFYYRPRTDLGFLKNHAQGLIALSACLSGQVQSYLLEDDYNGALETALAYEQIFGPGNFYLELQDHGIAEEKKVLRGLAQLHKETHIPLVATNDTHYVDRPDAPIHDVLLCIQTGKKLSDTDRMRFPSDQFYIKSQEEMAHLFAAFPGALQNTLEIARRCNVDLDFDHLHLPEFNIPEGLSHPAYLKKLVYSGLADRYPSLTDTIRDRADFELSTIESMGFTDYFLIVWDFIRYAKSQDIPVGPGRGSAAGSLVAYALKITDIDPLEYDLLFERFLNPERVSMPDIDVDFCYERREEVIDYVRSKYGEDHVAQIATFGTMAAKNAIRDVGRVMDLPYGQVDRVAKLIPNQLNITISQALDQADDLRAMYEGEGQIRRLIDTAQALEGMPRHISTHAAGVVICREPVHDLVPLATNGDAVITQFNMIELEELGLLKMDFLGLRNLTVIDKTVKMIKKTQGHHVDIHTIDRNDPKMLTQFDRAETLGIFQFESKGMRAFLRDLKPTAFTDLVAANSLYRPGPMSQIPQYIQNRENPDRINYIHPQLKDILEETHGIIVYQEQVMLIVQRLGGFTLGQADNLRRAMGKKKMEVMEKGRNRFVYGELEGDRVVTAGCIRNGVPEKAAHAIYDQMIEFAKYAFNKSHSAAYALVAVQTAWLKCYYPREFMACLLTSLGNQTTQLPIYIQECKRLGITVLAPDINASGAHFQVDGSSIRFGLTAIKNIGTGLVSAILRARTHPFTSFSDFVDRVTRVDRSSINRKALESLIMAGCFQSLDQDRAQLMQIASETLQSAATAQGQNLLGQLTLGLEDLHVGPTKYQVTSFSRQQEMQMEKEVLGLYLSDHPLEPYRAFIEQNTNFSASDFYEGQTNSQKMKSKVVFVGIITTVSLKMTRQNKQMAFVTLEDLYGNIEAIAFPEVYARYQGLLVKDQVLYCKGTFEAESDSPKVILTALERMAAPSNRAPHHLFLQIESPDPGFYRSNLRPILRRFKGGTPVRVHFDALGQTRLLRKDLWVDATNPMLMIELENLLGSANVRLNKE